MIKKPEKIYLVEGVTDLRYGIDGYARIVQDSLMLDPFSAAMYCFCNGRHNKLKILYWDGTGFWLLYKRLSRGTIKWPSRGDAAMEITEQQMGWLLDGISVEQKRAFRPSEAKYI